MFISSKCLELTLYVIEYLIWQKQVELSKEAIAHPLVTIHAIDGRLIIEMHHACDMNRKNYLFT